MAEKRILYFDCTSGISGDMTLGALLDLGADERQFLQEMEKLHVEGYHILIEETEKNGIRAKHVNVCVDGEPENCADVDMHTHGHDHAHGHPDAHEHIHSHPHRNFADIRRMISQSMLPENVKDLSLRIFKRVAAAEAKVHGKTVDEVHFHEVGAVDSIVDIVGCAVLMNMIKPDKIYASVLREGHGYVKCQHGLLSVPVPATSEILAAAGAPLSQIDIEGELVTPTGAAIIAELAEGFGTMPEMKMMKIGWGAGTKNLSIPNVLKVYMGAFAEKERTEEKNGGEKERNAGKDDDTENGCGDGCLHDEIVVLETNLDDCTGEMLGAAMEHLLSAGALDVFYTPVFMKKNRPAYRLTVLARPQDRTRMERLIYKHTTTIGIRYRTERRSILKREKARTATPYGEMEAKKVYLQDEVRLYPEYESAVKLAERTDKSLWEIYGNYEKL